MLNLAKALF